MKKSRILLLLLWGILFHSCEYEPKGVYDRNLDQKIAAPKIETVNLDLTQDKDTVELIYNRVYFNFKSTDQEIRWVKFYINDTLIGSVESANSYFDLDYTFLYEGTHRLRLEIFTKSGTGSIAESIGAEGFLFASREWIIKVKNTSYYNVTSTDSAGFLRLRWPKPFENTIEFVIYRGDQEIGRTTTCSFIDKGYVGEGAEFSVKYMNYTYKGLIPLGWVRIPNEIRLKYSYGDNNNYKIGWEKPRYYAAVDSIIIISGDHSYSPYDVQKTTDINSTGFEIPQSLFGLYRFYMMVLTPKYSNPFYTHSYSPDLSFCSPSINCMVGYPSPIYENFNRISSSQFIYHTSTYNHESTSYQDSIFRYLTTENRIIDRYRYNPPNYTWSGDHYWNPRTSPGGNHFIGVVGFTKTAIVSPTNSFKDYKIVDISNMTSNITKIPVSDIGTGIVIGSGKIYLYDFIHEKILGYVNNDTWFDDYDISQDGQYFFLRVSHTIWLYSFINNTLTLERTINSNSLPGIDYFNFIANQPGKAVCWNKVTKAFAILRCSDMEILKSFTVSEDEIWDIDYFANRILTFSPKLLVVRNLTDGTVQYKIPVSFSTESFNKCRLSGNSIFHQRGARYFLN